MVIAYMYTDKYNMLTGVNIMSALNGMRGTSSTYTK